jgi:hypothetical protein
MKWHLAAVVAITAGFAVGAAEASTSTNQLYIVSNDQSANHAALAASGNYNAVFIGQTHDGELGANTLAIDIFGDLNGGPLAAVFDAAPARIGLNPGQIVQNGHGNAISVAITGNQNLFAISQLGAGNALTGVITGNNNQAAVAQVGSGNTFSFVQNGNGNVLSVIQRSR